MGSSMSLMKLRIWARATMMAPSQSMRTRRWLLCTAVVWFVFAMGHFSFSIKIPHRRPGKAQCGTGETTAYHQDMAPYAGITRIRYEGHGRRYALISAGIASSAPVIRSTIWFFLLYLRRAGLSRRRPWSPSRGCRSTIHVGQMNKKG